MATQSSQDSGMITLLKEQLQVFKQVQALKQQLSKVQFVAFRQEPAHKKRRTLVELAFYPAHEPRKSTSQYKAVQKNLVDKLDRPCLICGVSKSTLKDRKKNPYGAKQMETHHHVIEWSLANAIDVNKFNTLLLPFLKRRHPKRPEYNKNFSEKEVRNWVDHHEDNLWVLCDVHHRAKYFGIHEITYPIWGPADLLRDDFEEYVRSEIEKEK
ncbi:MAG TPA: hypothetical protein VE222_00325 [Nitrospiraceae bacterium]|nr:hypothetical protein [Nitrospiraceae bacterium]